MPSPLAAETAASTWRESAASDSRIITPAFAHGCVLSTPSTRATMAPSPVSRLVDEHELVRPAPDVRSRAADGRTCRCRRSPRPARPVCQRPQSPIQTVTIAPRRGSAATGKAPLPLRVPRAYARRVDQCTESMSLSCVNEWVSLPAGSRVEFNPPPRGERATGVP